MKKFIFILLFGLPNLISAQIITTYVGSTGIYDPNGLAFDNHGNLYIATLLGNTIGKIDTNGIVSRIAGTGTTGFGGDGGQATNALLDQPCYLVIDKQGDIIFSDVLNSRIRKVNVSTGIISSIAGIATGGAGTGGFSGDLGPAILAALNYPSGICYDSIGNLYISDKGNKRIRKIDTFGIITTIAGNGILGVTLGDNGPATAASIYPSGICVDKFNNIYFTQYGGEACGVRRINSIGIITTIAGDSSQYIYNGDGIPATNAHLGPEDIKIDKYNNLFIVDATNNRIRKIDTFGIIHTVVGNGIAGHSGDSGLATSAEMTNISCLTFDYCNNLYISEVGGPSCIRKVAFNPYCSSTSINNTEIFQNIYVYPNPAAEEITISGVKADVKFGLFNIKCIIEQQGILKAGSNTLSIESLSPGLYILELTMDDGTRIMKKIIKL